MHVSSLGDHAPSLGREEYLAARARTDLDGLDAQYGGRTRVDLLNTMPCSRLRHMDDQISSRPHLATVANVRGATCGSSGLPAGIVVHPVAAPSTASAP
jgi:hypothetical protein